MIVIYRVNSEAKILLLNTCEFANTHIDEEFIYNNVLPVFSIHDLEDAKCGFLQEKGFKRGSPIRIEVDDKTGRPIRVVWE